MIKVFISYRRDGGEALAQVIYDRLTKKGYHVFYDIESLSSGAFDKALYEHIDESDFFVLILSPQALERCIFEEDWVRKEILYAHEQEKTIIPLFTRGFGFANLPNELDWLPFQNGVQLDSMMYLDSAIEKLISFFDNSPRLSSRRAQNTLNIDAEITRHHVNETKTSPFLQRMSDKLLKQYLDGLLTKNNEQSESEAFYKGNYLFIPINDGKLHFYSSPSIDVHAFVVYAYAYDKKTKNLKKTVEVCELERNKAQSGYVFSLKEETIHHNEYCHYGKTTILTLTKIIEDNNPLFSLDTTKSVNDEILQSGTCHIVNIESCPGFGEERIFTILLNHIEQQIVHAIKAKYSRMWQGGGYQEYIVIDTNYRTIIPYATPQNKNSAIMKKCEKHFVSYSADSDAANILYCPVSCEVIHRQVPEEGGTELILEAERPMISVSTIVSFEPDIIERPMTAYELGRCYFDGTCGFARNVFIAMRYFEEDGSADALYEAGLFAYRNKEFGDKKNSISVWYACCNLL